MTYSTKNAEFAKGGAKLGRTRDFMKEPDRFRGKPNPKVEQTEDVYPKTGTAGKLAKTTGDKSEKAIKSRS